MIYSLRLIQYCRASLVFFANHSHITTTSLYSQCFSLSFSYCAFLSRIHQKEGLFAKILICDLIIIFAVFLAIIVRLRFSFCKVFHNQFLGLRFHQRLQRFSLFIFRIVLFFPPHNPTIWDGRVGTKTLANISLQIETNWEGGREKREQNNLNYLS
jgi:hypothetical protein